MSRSEEFAAGHGMDELHAAISDFGKRPDAKAWEHHDARGCPDCVGMSNAFAEHLHSRGIDASVMHGEGEHGGFHRMVRAGDHYVDWTARQYAVDHEDAQTIPHPLVMTPEDYRKAPGWTSLLTASWAAWPPRSRQAWDDLLVSRSEEFAAGHDAFVMVHPEGVPSVHHDVSDDEYARQVRAAAKGRRKVAILDEYGVEDRREGVQPVGLSSHWRGIQAEPHELDDEKVGERLRSALGDAKSVAVGGYARSDCVPRVVEHLKRLGYEAHLHDPTTLPPGNRS